MATYQLNVNGQSRQVNVDPSTPLLWVLRDNLNLTGTKFGCGIAQCGACTVHIDGNATRSCVTPASAVAGKKVTARIKRVPDPTIISIVSGWPRDFVTDRAKKLGFTTAEKTFDDIIRIHIEDELGGKFAA